MPIIDATTRSVTHQYSPGLIDVYGGRAGVLLTVRNAPDDVYEMRSVELTPSEAREVADALLKAAASADAQEW